MPKHLNIWWVSHYASTPDQQYTAQFDLAKKLVEKGHRVTFFAAGFSHYKFQELRLKHGETWREEECEGVKFVWIRTWPYRANNWRRAYNMLSFAWRAYWVASRKRADAPDLIIGTTFHPLSSLSGYFLSIAKGTPFVFEVRDLWPLTMVEFGRFSRFNPLALVLAALEKFLARRASRIMTTLPRAADYYVELGITREKIVWIPNGLDLSRYSDLKAYEGNLHDPCVLLYAGGHVSANALDTIIRAAKIQQDRNNSVKFLFVGGGQEKTKLIRLATELNLKNIEFRDVVPKRELRHIMEQADAFILSMRNLPRLYRYGMSFNKLCDYVSSGRPVLFAGNPGANVVEEFQCGIVVSPEDPVAFAAAIEEFTSMSVERRVEMGRNGIRCARERFDIAAIGGRLEAMLISLMRDAPLTDEAEAVGKLSGLKAS
jgi:glycosyltransferase involved in cell wall biosynthesis